MKNTILSLLVLFSALAATKVASAAVQPNPIFSDGAVLQRDKPVPIWGTADEGEKVTVTFAGQTESTTARNGKWEVRLKPLTASATPQTLTIKGQNTVTLNNILVGEVWLCGGQSNMEWTLSKSAGGREAIAASTNPQIRFFYVPHNSSAQPLTEVKASWEECSPKTAARFSGVGYFFGRDLQQKLKVPVGLIGSYVGGTPAEKWTSRAALESNPTLKVFLDQQARAESKYDPAKAEADYQAALARHRQAVADATAAGKPAPKPPTKAGNPAGRGPSSLYNAMIAPLQPYALRGVIWYQGESNRGNPKLYGTLFPALIADWRKAWDQGDFPFLFVQIAPFGGVTPELRDVHLKTWLKTPNTAMAVITDHGSTSIHPPEKEPVGQRLALAARALAYGEKIEFSGPLYDSIQIKGDKAVLHFKHVGSGLMARDGELKGFVVAGADKKFVPAEAKIEGDTVVVSSPQVAAPAAVRYGWANVPDVNLFNKEGLPASPFRTDSD